MTGTLHPIHNTDRCSFIHSAENDNNLFLSSYLLRRIREHSSSICKTLSPHRQQWEILNGVVVCTTATRKKQRSLHSMRRRKTFLLLLATCVHSSSCSFSQATRLTFREGRRRSGFWSWLEIDTSDTSDQSSSCMLDVDLWRCLRLLLQCVWYYLISIGENGIIYYFQVNTVYRWNAWNAFLNNIRNQNFVFLKPTEHTRKSAAVSRSGLQISFRSWVINYALGAGVTNFDYLLNALSRLNQDMLNAILFFLLKENSRDQSRNFSSSMNFICFSYRDWWSLLNVFQFPAHSLLTV